MTRRSVFLLGHIAGVSLDSPGLRTGIRADRATGHRPARAHLCRRRHRPPRTRWTDRHRTAFHAAARRRSRPHAGGPRRNPVRRRQRAAPRRADDGRFPVGRGGAIARRARASERVAGRHATSRIASTRRRPGCRSTTRASIACPLLRGDEVELAVLRGGAELVNEQGRSYVSAGERTYARLQAAPSPAYVFNSAAWDSFDRWSESRRDQRLGVSAQYLPEDVRRYAPAFDTYGSWRHEPAYGYVWYPRVQVGWRPYYRGRWASLRPYGWTWIANDPWGWPTHHYGRWGISAGSWFWIPGRSWAPAWVSWGYAPGYVSWCPLGWNNRPVLGFSVNYYGGRRYDPWYAWSVLPRGHFSSPYVHVSRYQTVRVDPRLHGSFVVNHRGPDVHFAVNRSGVPIRTAGRSSAWRGDGYRATGDSGGARVSAAPAGGRDGERRFPAGARAPGSPVNNAPPDRAAIRSRDDGRSLSREGTGRSGNADAPPVTTDSSRARMRADVTPAAPDGSARGFRRGDGSEPRTVTEAPAGAVRAVPRVRGADGGSNGAPPQQLRSYSTAPREAPAATAPPAPQQRYREPDAGYRSPQNRAIMRGSDERSAPREPGPRAGVERNGGSYEPRSFGGGAERQAPAPAPRSFGGGGERQAPSAAPRSAPSAPRGDGDGGPRGGSGRARSGDGGGTGQAVGRRR